MTPTAKPHPLLDAVRQAVVEHLPSFAKARTEQTTAMLEQFEADIAPHIAPIVDQLLADPNTPDQFRSLLGAMTAPTHFGESIVIGIALGAIIAPVLNAALAPALQALTNTAWHGAATTTGNAGTIRPSPDVLASAVLKGVFTDEGAAASIAADSGVSAADFHTLVETAGQSPGIEQGLLLLRRGQISQAEFERIVRYSNVRDDFLPDILALKFSPPSAGEVIMGAVKTHLTDADAQQKLSEAGIDPTNYAWLKASAGRPIGVEQAVKLWKHQLITEAQLDQVIAQSDINPDYAAEVKLTGIYLVPPRSIVPMLRSGGITEARARTLLTLNGVTAEDQDAFVKEATTSSSTTAKELTMSQVVSMYENRFITNAEANTRLQALKYPADQITLLLGYADDNRKIKLTNALISKVATLYVGRKIDKTTATTALNGDTVPADVQADLFHVWDLERTAAVHHPTVTQVVGAYRREEITAADCKARLENLGVQPGDLGIIVVDGWPPTHAADGRAAALAVINA